MFFARFFLASSISFYRAFLPSSIFWSILAITASIESSSGSSSSTGFFAAGLTTFFGFSIGFVPGGLAYTYYCFWTSVIVDLDNLLLATGCYCLSCKGASWYSFLWVDGGSLLKSFLSKFRSCYCYLAIYDTDFCWAIFLFSLNFSK